MPKIIAESVIKNPDGETEKEVFYDNFWDDNDHETVPSSPDEEEGFHSCDES